MPLQFPSPPGDGLTTLQQGLQALRAAQQLDPQGGAALAVVPAVDILRRSPKADGTTPVSLGADEVYTGTDGDEGWIYQTLVHIPEENEPEPPPPPPPPAGTPTAIDPMWDKPDPTGSVLQGPPGTTPCPADGEAGGDVAPSEPRDAEDYPRFREAMQTNLLAAVVALSRRQPHRAEEYLGRNVALGDRLLSGPEPFGVTFGAGVLRSLALRPLVLVRESEGDTTAATALREAATRVMGYVSLDAWTISAAGLAADPAEWSAYVQMLTSRRVLTAHRLAALKDAEAASCLNPREIVAGPSEERQRGILALADAMADLPQARTIARNETAWPLHDPASKPVWTHQALRWPIAGGLMRLASCARSEH